MSRFRATFGDPEGPEVKVFEGDSVDISPTGPNGGRSLKVWEENGAADNKSNNSLVAEMTVGPDHILGYEPLD